MRIGFLPVLLVLLVMSTGCRSMYFANTLDEFNSATHWIDENDEPDDAIYSETPRQHSEWGLLFGMGMSEALIDNPSGFVRQNAIELVEYAGRDPREISLVVRRLLWMLSRDPSTFNRICALEGLERILETLEMDLLDLNAYYQEIDPQEGERAETRFRQEHQRLTDLFGRADRPAMSEEQRSEYISTLRDYTARPLPRLRWQRDQLQTLWSILEVETDPDVRAAGSDALRTALKSAMCNGVRAALVPEDRNAADLPDVRLRALLLYRRVSGIAALPFVLRFLARPQLEAAGQSYDPDLEVRRALVRMCAQLKYEHAILSFEGGPMPIEFLYDTASGDEDAGLRRVALEGLARCLSEEREGTRISLELEWAREWWREFVAQRDR